MSVACVQPCPNWSNPFRTRRKWSSLVGALTPFGGSAKWHLQQNPFFFSEPKMFRRESIQLVYHEGQTQKKNLSLWKDFVLRTPTKDLYVAVNWNPPWFVFHVYFVTLYSPHRRVVTIAGRLAGDESVPGNCWTHPLPWFRREKPGTGDNYLDMWKLVNIWLDKCGDCNVVSSEVLFTDTFTAVVPVDRVVVWRDSWPLIPTFESWEFGMAAYYR